MHTHTQINPLYSQFELVKSEKASCRFTFVWLVNVMLQYIPARPYTLGPPNKVAAPSHCMGSSGRVSFTTSPPCHGRMRFRTGRLNSLPA